MAPSVWRFVDQPIASPTVLLDMNNGTTWRTLSDDFDVSPPPLKRSIASNAMTDGGLLTASAYDLREIKFTVQLEGATEAARNQQIKDLGRELAKPSNLLMYQSQHASTPVFFRTLRSDNWELDNQFIPNVAWRAKVSVLAEPFAIGVRVDLPQVTVTNDPASGTNPTRWDMTGIVGDAPSPAFVRIQSLGGGSPSLILAQRTINNPADVTVFAQAELGTLSTDTTTWAAGTTYSGTGNRATQTTFATSSLTLRLTVTCPTSSSASAIQGSYRVLVRGTSSTGANLSVLLQAAQGTGGSSLVKGPKLTFDIIAGTFQYFDLGKIQIPAVTPRLTQIGYSGLAPQFPLSEPIQILASRLSGTTNLLLDYVYLLPCDERLCMVKQQTGLAGYLVLDGPNDAVYMMEAGTSPFGATRTVDQHYLLTPRIGGLPELVPGVTNRWYMLTDLAVTDTKTVDVSYWPRWREVATA